MVSQALTHITWPEAEVAACCRRWKISELSLFGSVLRDDFRPDSDIDVLVSWEPNSRWTLFDIADMELELSSILGRSVDLVSKSGVEQSPNNIRRTAILDSARVVYAA